MWSLRGVRFRHAGAASDTLKDISLDVASNAITALLGPNGTGKSTLLHLLLGVSRPDDGELLFNNRPLSSYTRKALALEIGVVPQGEVDPMFSVRDIVAMGRYPRLGPWQRERPEDRRAIDRAMERADVAQFAGRWVSTLSGGERQRVRVARALAQEARVLVLDEPTTYLDIRHEMTTFELLHNLRMEGVTVVLATHNLNLAARYADRLVMMHDGKIVVSGTPAHVLTSQRVGDVYEWPVEIVPHESGAPQVVPSGMV
ncbi:MAG: ABC transporter ATP-binding protein, partial [Gemmatimonadaceae bacterium]